MGDPRDRDNNILSSGDHCRKMKRVNKHSLISHYVVSWRRELASFSRSLFSDNLHLTGSITGGSYYIYRNLYAFYTYDGFLSAEFLFDTVDSDEQV